MIVVVADLTFERITSKAVTLSVRKEINRETQKEALAEFLRLVSIDYPTAKVGQVVFYNGATMTGPD